MAIVISASDVEAPSDEPISLSAENAEAAPWWYGGPGGRAKGGLGPSTLLLLRTREAALEMQGLESPRPGVDLLP